MVASALIFQSLFGTKYGVINTLLGVTIPWLQEPSLTRMVIIVLLIWRRVGWWFVIFLAGLTAINPEVEEAAQVDGANGWQQLMRITIPLMRNTFLFAFVVDAIASFRLFAEPNVLVGLGGSLAPPEVAPVLNLLLNNLRAGSVWGIGFGRLDPLHHDRHCFLCPVSNPQGRFGRRGGALMSQRTVLIDDSAQVQIKSARHYNWVSRIRAILGYSALVFTVLLSLYPVWVMVLNSFKSDSEVSWNPAGLPETWTLESYAAIFEFHGGMWINFLNSVFISVTSTVVALVLVSMAAFAFAKYQFAGRDAIFFLLLATMMVPSEITVPPLYLMFARMGWLNTYQVQIVPTVTSVFGLFLVRQYMLGIPNALIEAARIDGANHWQIYRHIMIPTSAPILGAFAILHFQGVWNSYLWPLGCGHRAGRAADHGGAAKPARPDDRLPACVGNDYGRRRACHTPHRDCLRGISGQVHVQCHHRRRQGIARQDLRSTVYPPSLNISGKDAAQTKGSPGPWPDSITTRTNC